MTIQIMHHFLEKQILKKLFIMKIFDRTMALEPWPSIG
jgi:hypothetical protein